MAAECKDPDCGRSFEDEDAMERHYTQKHDTFEVFICPNCSDGFETRDGLDWHYYKEHEGELEITSKVCRSCGQEKPLSEFHPTGKANGVLQPNCKTCDNKRLRKRYKTVKGEWEEEKLNRGCRRCGYDEHAAALDFHHPEGVDKQGWERGSGSWAYADFLDRMDDLIVLCANCHRVIHHVGPD